MKEKIQKIIAEYIFNINDLQLMTQVPKRTLIQKMEDLKEQLKVIIKEKETMLKLKMHQELYGKKLRKEK